MEIFFCSHCNQSIPLKDIQSGSAELRRGKYLCITCREIVPSARERAPNFAAMYLGIFLMGALAVIAFFLFQDDLFPSPKRALAASTRTRDVLSEAIGELRRDLQTSAHRTDSRLDEGFGAFDARLQRQEDALRRTSGQIEKLDSRDASGVSEADVLMLKNRIQSVHSEIQSLREDVAGVRDAVRRLRGVVREAAVPEPKPEPKKPEPVKRTTEADRWIAQLDDPVPGKRFTAVAELSRFKDPKVVTALIGRLQDDDFFIRRYVAEELGERKAAGAVPPLVRALLDDEISVREAAVQALRKITGRSFGFKSSASARERGRAVGKWKSYVATLERKK